MSDTTATKKGEVHYNAQGDAVSFVGEDATHYYRLVVLKHSLSLELKTGMRMSRYGSALGAAKRTTGLKTNNRQLHIDKLAEMIEEARASLVHIKAEK